MPTLTKHRVYWLTAGFIVLVLLVVVWPLHLGTRISGGAQHRLYDETVDLVMAQQNYAVTHQGAYAVIAVDLATANPGLAFAANANTSPVTQFVVDASGHGYYIQLADQSTGGAGSFSVLVPDRGRPVLSCTGPAPLCTNGTFKLPVRVDTSLANDQAMLYKDTVDIVVAQHAYAAASGGRYAPNAQDLAIRDPAVSFVLGSATPVTTLVPNSSGHGYYLKLAGLSRLGAADFSVIVPSRGTPVLTCVGSAPLCIKGKFKLPAGTLT